MALLKASMKSETVLTDVFLGSQSRSPEIVLTPVAKSGSPFVSVSASPFGSKSGFSTTSPWGYTI